MVLTEKGNDPRDTPIILCQGKEEDSVKGTEKGQHENVENVMICKIGDKVFSGKK